ncbi:RAMP superfamily CRISPR-associated protein [Fusobacterium hwasookii]|uniref:RAMP superfamily CRISPR-associated protein n=1 Tax=Fusobacterium hwasookii TaxID=1583098 RepID=UPI001C6EE4A7|nr:RAMP superfamily CRISPR-associated protein [Fusobacterium hwasookii]QYR54488.1 hypothetical protein JY400_08145 [Fusobacterium hwasookii]
MDFSMFNNKYIIKGKLVVLTALHIGSGVEENGHDAPFITIEKKYSENKDGNPKGEYFYIPGSSFRGYLSTKLERLLAKENNYKFITDKGELNEGDVKLIFGYTNLLRKDKEKKFIEDKDVIKNVLKEFLDTETIERALKDEEERNKDEVAFEEAKKYSSMSGKIHISDMKILSKFNKSIKRDGIKIDRNTGATEKGGKFDYDILPPGTGFEFIMELDNVEDYQLDLIKIALIDILEGDLFGGKISRGIGKCKLILNEVEFIDAKDKQDLENYIFKKDMRKIVSKKDDKEVEKNEEFKKFFEIKKLKLGK